MYLIPQNRINATQNVHQDVSKQYFTLDYSHGVKPAAFVVLEMTVPVPRRLNYCKLTTIADYYVTK